MSDFLDDQLGALAQGPVPPLAPASLIRSRGEQRRRRTRIATSTAGLVLALGVGGTALALTSGQNKDALQFAPPGPTATAPAPVPSTAPPTPTPKGPLTADDEIRIDGIGPIVFGMTLAEAERAAGQPFTAFVDELGNGCGFVAPTSKSPDISLMVVRGIVIRVDIGLFDGTNTTRTDAGIGIGSTEQDVKDAYGAAVKVTKHQYTAGNYLTVTSPDGALALVMETDGQVVTVIRGGTADAAQYNEGCA